MILIATVGLLNKTVYPACEHIKIICPLEVNKQFIKNENNLIIKPEPTPYPANNLLKFI